jgi:hypothetical protein
VRPADCGKAPTLLPNIPSGGTVLLILFGVCLGFYLVVGFAYQRFVVGATGLDQIPNIHFWLDILELVAVRARVSVVVLVVFGTMFLAKPCYI